MGPLSPTGHDTVNIPALLARRQPAIKGQGQQLRPAMMKPCIHNFTPAHTAVSAPNGNSICRTAFTWTAKSSTRPTELAPPGTTHRCCTKSHVTLASPTWNRPILSTLAPAAAATALLSPSPDAKAKEKKNGIKKTTSNKWFELQPFIFMYFKFNYLRKAFGLIAPY